MPELRTVYLQLDDAKSTLNIESNSNDNIIQEDLDEANRTVDASIQVWAGGVELPANIQRLAQAAAKRMFKALWFERHGQLERAKHNDEAYEKRIMSLEKAIRSIRTDATQDVFIVPHNPLNVTYQPANTDEYITRVFGGGGDR